jgi:meiosis-specific protein HOP1
METQLTPFAQTQMDGHDSIESFQSKAPGKTQEARNVTDHGLECDCGVNVSPILGIGSVGPPTLFSPQIEDASCFCDAGCGRWYHLWCDYMCIFYIFLD